MVRRVHGSQRTFESHRDQGIAGSLEQGLTNMQRKQLIEVALPLEAINKASAREKSIRHGHPSTLHLWWAHWVLTVV